MPTRVFPLIDFFDKLVHVVHDENLQAALRRKRPARHRQPEFAPTDLLARALLSLAIVHRALLAVDRDGIGVDEVFEIAEFVHLGAVHGAPFVPQWGCWNRVLRDAFPENDWIWGK